MRSLFLYIIMLVALFLSLLISSESFLISIQYHVWEEQSAGTQVGRLVDDLRQRDKVGPLEDFQVVKQGKAIPFSVTTREGIITTQGRLDREELCRGSDLCKVVFSVLYRKSGTINCLKVCVEVMDLNDHSPSFPSALQKLEISETASLQKRIPLERALDPDAGLNSLQTYSLSVNPHFALDVTTGPGGTKQAELVVIKQLDRETQDAFDLTLVAYDKGNPPKSGSTLVHVRIQDTNDNSPAFEDISPTVTLTEDTALGTTIIKLTATDPDQGANGEVEYSFSKLTHPEVQKLFHVDSQTGDVIIKAPLDYEVQSSHELIIQATDRGPNGIPAHCMLHVKLIDVNDNAPRIRTTWTSPASDVATVLEGAAIDTFLTLVTLYDADSGKNGEVSAVIKEGSGPFQIKHIDSHNFKIVTSGILDREKVMNYNITLLAQDHGTPPLFSVEYLPVSVLDENDNNPVFSNFAYRTYLKENNIADEEFLQVEAHDVDLALNGKVSYYIRDSADLKTKTKSFSIHATTGIISVRHSLDFETSNSYSFIVEAVDYGHPPLTGTATVYIDLEDVNDNVPVIKEPQPREGVVSVSILVNACKGEIVSELENNTEEKPITLQVNLLVKEELPGYLASTIKGEDLDSGLNGQLKYLISDGNPNGLFWMDQATGRLFVNTSNATELIGRTFKMGLTVSDMGTPSLDTKATLEVTFINLKDHLKNSSLGNQGHFSFNIMIAICLGVASLLLLLTITLVTFCRPKKRGNRAYNCRQAESSYTGHPCRPQKNIKKSDIQLIPIVRGRKEELPVDDNEVHSRTPPSLSVDQQTEREYNFILPSFHSKGFPKEKAPQHITHHCKTLRKPANIELDGTFTLIQSTSYSTLNKTRNPSSASSSASNFGTLKNKLHSEGEEKSTCLTSQDNLGRPKISEGQGPHDEEHRQMLHNLVHLSMAAFGDSIKLSSASPEVQISQLLSLLRQGQLQPRTNFRGNKYSNRNGRYGGQDCSDWQSTKDSGHGESEPGDVDWEPGRESPIDSQLEEGLSLLSNSDDVFSEVSNNGWMARLSLPLTIDYHENIFVPKGPPSPESELPLQDGLNSSASFSTFGKTPEKVGPLGEALLSDVSTLFKILMTQKADTHLDPRPNILYRLSTEYHRSVGLDTTTMAAGNIPKNCAEKRPNPAASSPFYQ
ncbi:protocadherin-12 isoform X2 [Kryptolebias marmoratus]|uniref:protocadherin-12 isoform X2 n=1 Tax=Kryptolebias marmoratus TaxID=37003 RepID=UPI0018ACFE9E|nr:protocadherin-12 isoform X2 [Kryptolebias marmoratus]